MGVLASYSELSDALKVSFKRCGYVLRPRGGPGLWLVPLVPLALLCGTLKQIFRGEGALTHIYFATTVVSCGLLVATVLYLMRFVPSKGGRIDNYWFSAPAVGTLLFLLLTQNGFVLSLFGGIISTYGVLAGLPTLLVTAPGCFTIGEAVIIVHAFVSFVYSATVNIVHASLSQVDYLSEIGVSYEVATIILQVGGIGVVGILSTLLAFPITREPPQFYMVLSTAILATVVALHSLLGGSPILWILYNITRDQGTFNLFLTWVVLSILGCVFIYCQVSQCGKATTSQRKTFHVLSVVVFTTGILWMPDLLYLASGVCFAIFLVLEAARILRIPPLGDVLHHSFKVYSDEKDTLVALTPLYLLAGMALPLWLTPLDDVPIAPSKLLPYLAGVLSIGVGDTAASYIGSKYGQFKWPGSTRTIEGTTACVFSQVAFLGLLIFYDIVPGDYLTLLISVGAIGITSLIEANTDQVDNLVLPLVFYILTL